MEKWKRRTRWRVWMGAVAVAVMGGVALLGMGGTASAVPNTATCDGLGLLGDKLYGSNRGTSVSSPAGRGTVSEDKRSWEMTINKGWTATGIVIRRGQNIEVYQGEYVGPTSVSSEHGGTMLNTTSLPQVTSWYVCGERTPASARGAAAPRPSPTRNVWMIGTPPSWPKDAPFGPATMWPSAGQPAPAPPNAQAPNGQAPKPKGQGQQAPQAPGKAPNVWVEPAPPIDARAAANHAPMADEPATHDDDATLPITGVPAGLLAAVGMVLVAAGAGLLYSARRRTM